MISPNTKNITDAFEGVLYPTPYIIPDKQQTTSMYVKGFVVFDFTYYQNLEDYVEMSGGIHLNTALGITEDNLYNCARKYLSARYGAQDIVLGKPRYASPSYLHRILIRYRVNK